jgi:hypothetical protein
VARTWHVDLAGVLLIAWAGLIAYVSVPTLLGDEPLWDGGVSLLGALVAAAHLVAAWGVFTRHPWGRRLGLVVGGVGAVGTGIVLLTLAANLGSVAAPAGPTSPLVLGIPAAMFATYLAVVVILWRARPDFAHP